MERDLQITEASPSDAREIAELIRASFAEYQGALSPPTGAHEESAASIERKLRESKAVVARVQGELAGVVFFRRQANALYFDRLAVKPAHREQGLATTLVREVERRAVADSVPRVTLRARLAQPGNIAFFASLGYAIYSKAPHSDTRASVYALMEKSIRRGAA